MTEERSRLFTEDKDNIDKDDRAKADEFVKSKVVDKDFVQDIRQELDDDIRMHVVGKMSSVIH